MNNRSMQTEIAK